MIDVFDDAELEVSESGLSKLTAMYERWRDLDLQVSDLEAQLKVAKDAKRQIEEKDFPDLFDEVGITSFEAANGKKISLKEKLYGSLPAKEEDREVAIAEVERLDGRDIFVAEVNVKYPKGQTEHAEEVVQKLQSNGDPATLKVGVHASTYQAWAREQLANGANPDLSKLGLFNRRFAEIK